MTLSRMAIIILAATAHAGATAQTLTAEEALANHRRGMAQASSTCGTAAGLDPEEVIVCGRRTGPSMRLPLPVQPEPGARVNGEVASATSGLAPERCTAVGRNQSCSGGLPLIPMAIMAVQGAKKVVEAIVDPD